MYTGGSLAFVQASEGSYLKVPVRGMPEVVLCFLVHEHVHTVTHVCAHRASETMNIKTEAKQILQHDDFCLWKQLLSIIF